MFGWKLCSLEEESESFGWSEAIALKPMVASDGKLVTDFACANVVDRSFLDKNVGPWTVSFSVNIVNGFLINCSPTSTLGLFSVFIGSCDFVCVKLRDSNAVVVKVEDVVVAFVSFSVAGAETREVTFLVESLLNNIGVMRFL